MPLTLTRTFTGLSVTFDLTHPVGSRVRQLEIVCTNCTVPKMLPVKPDQQYRVVLPTFVAEGGDGYRVIMEETLEHNNIGKYICRIVVGVLCNE